MVARTCVHPLQLFAKGTIPEAMARRPLFGIRPLAGDGRSFPTFHGGGGLSLRRAGI